MSNMRLPDALPAHARRSELATGQNPFAIILGCSDSRVPPELVFDQGLGDLFVVRVAGNVVMPSQAGSVELAAVGFGTRLVVVLGHARCGAVLAALEEIEHGMDGRSPNLRSITDQIRLAVECLLATKIREDPEALVREAVRANVRASADHLRHGSQVLAELMRDDGLVVVGAEYSLDTGSVDFFEGLPDAD